MFPCVSHDACHNIVNGVNCARILSDRLTDGHCNERAWSLQYIHPDIKYHGVITYEDCQKMVAWFPDHVFLLGLGSKC